MFVKALSIIHPLLFCKVMWGENFVLCQTKPVCMSVCAVGVGDWFMRMSSAFSSVETKTAFL